MDIRPEKYKSKKIPTHGKYHYIYKKELNDIAKIDPMEEYTYYYIGNIFDVNGLILKQMYSLWNLKEFLKSLVKIMVPSRMFYCLILKKKDICKIVSYGWIKAGKCRRYDVGKKGIVIGFICTDERERGRGFGAYALKRTLNSLFENGFKDIYMDTHINNIGAQKLFVKCGFCGPIDYYLKTDKP